MMNDIKKDLDDALCIMHHARKLIPAVSIEMHPMLYRDVCKIFRRDIYIGSCDLRPLEFFGLKLLTNVKLKHWACLVRDKAGKVIKVLRVK
ncbi:MAG: hypothetical protein ACYTEQ_25985 [Planctomycetota bacterium]